VPNLVLVTAPTVEPLEVDEVKAHLRVDFPDDDQLIKSQMRVAREYVENTIDYALLPQVYDQFWDAFPTSAKDWLELGKFPATAVTWVKYTDSAGNVNTWTGTPLPYVFDPNGYPKPRLMPAFGQLWPSTTLQPIAAVNVRFAAGFPDALSVPFLLKHAQKMLIAAWYENRADVEVDTRLRAVLIPRAVDDILSKFGEMYVA